MCGAVMHEQHWMCSHQTLGFSRWQCFGLWGDWILHNRGSITVRSHNASLQQHDGSSSLERHSTSRLLSFSISLSPVSLSISASHLSVLCHSLVFHSAPPLPHLLRFIILLWLFSFPPHVCLGLPLRGGMDSLIVEERGNSSARFSLGKVCSPAFFSPVEDGA